MIIAGLANASRRAVGRRNGHVGMRLLAGDAVRVRAALDVRAEPLQSSELRCRLHGGVIVRCTEVRVLQANTWICTSSGWLVAMNNESDEPFVLTVDDPTIADSFWAHEVKKQKKMASAIASSLIRSYSLPRAKRLARSIWKHAEAHYPQRGLANITGEGIEDIMISLGGKTGLGKQELFEYIKAAAARHSCPGESIMVICQEIFDIFTSRPSAWVTEDLNVIVTEDVRIDNNRFVMSAAEGNVKEFQGFLARGLELTCLHSDLRYTALHAASDFGQTAILECIIASGFSMNVRDPVRGQTPLHFAAYSGRPETAKLLIAAGADRTIRCLRGVLPHEAAAKQGHEECSDVLKFLLPTALDLQVVETGVNMLKLNWRPPTMHKAHHAPLLHYALTFCTADTPFERYDALLSVETISPQWTITGLLPSLAYKVRVRCWSVSGWSAWSAWTHGTTRASAPDAPDPVEIIKVSINTILLRWQAPARDNGHIIDHYELEVMDEEMSRVGRSHTSERVDHRKMIKQKADALSSTTASQGGVSKLHRLLLHRDAGNLLKNITGLEPGRRYVLRCRCHNKLGYSAFSDWSRPVAPQYGVELKRIISSGGAAPLRANMTWFTPMLNDCHSVACYEVQICRLQGPITTTHKSTLGCGLDEEEPMENSSEYITVSSNVLTNEFTVDDLKAGAKYRCRVRPRIKDSRSSASGTWVAWDDGMSSELFCMPPTVPDPPLKMLPCRLNPALLRTKRTRATDSTHDLPEADAEEPCASVMGSAPKSTMSSMFTAADSISSHFDERSTVPHFIISGTLDRNYQDTDLGSEVWEISHNCVKLTWQPGEGNGLPIDELEIDRAEVRLHSCEDLLRVNALLCDNHAYDGVSTHAESLSHDPEPDDMSMQSDDASSSQRGSSGFSVAAESLHWETITQTHGRFLSPQIFLATDLTHGAAYCFRIRQRNSLGWSQYSVPTPVIGTHPSSPPERVSVVTVGQTYAHISVFTDSSLTSLEFEAQTRQYGSESVGVDAGDGTGVLQDWTDTHIHIQTDGADSVADALLKTSGYDDLLDPILEQSPTSGHGLVPLRVMVSGLVEGQFYSVRLRRRTVLGWSPFSTPSEIFRSQR